MIGRSRDWVNQNPINQCGAGCAPRVHIFNRRIILLPTCLSTCLLRRLAAPHLCTMSCASPSSQDCYNKCYKSIRSQCPEHLPVRIFRWLAAHHFCTINCAISSLQNHYNECYNSPIFRPPLASVATKIVRYWNHAHPSRTHAARTCLVVGRSPDLSWLGSQRLPRRRCHAIAA